jgi:hypothetical protein
MHSGPLTSPKTTTLSRTDTQIPRAPKIPFWRMARHSFGRDALVANSQSGVRARQRRTFRDVACDPPGFVARQHLRVARRVEVIPTTCPWSSRATHAPARGSADQSADGDVTEDGKRGASPDRASHARGTGMADGVAARTSTRGRVVRRYVSGFVWPLQHGMHPIAIVFEHEQAKVGG